MAVFYVLLLIPVLFQHIEIKGLHIDYEKKNQRLITFFFIFLTILIAFRGDSIGNDTRNYIWLFSRAVRKSWTNIGRMQLETGFSYYMEALSMISDNPRFFLAISAVLVSAMIWPSYRRLTSDVSLTVVLFCTMSTFFMMFSGIRQMLAIGIGFLAYELTRSRRPFLFALAVLAAMQFHTSAFMLALLYPLYHAKITKKWLYVIVPVTLGLFVFNRPIFSVLASVMERYTRFDSSVVSTGAYMMIVLFSLFTAFAFVIPDEKLLDEETIGLRNILLLSLLLQMFAPLHTLAMRMNYYYVIFVPLLMPKIVEASSVRWRQVAAVGRNVMVVFFLVYFFLTATQGSHLHVAPYHFFWETGI